MTIPDYSSHHWQESTNREGRYQLQSLALNTREECKDKVVRAEGSLTVSMSQNVAFNSLKILTGDSRRKNPKAVK